MPKTSVSSSIVLLSTAAVASYLAALFLPEDGRWGVSGGATLEGDTSPLGGNLIPGLGGNLRWNWKWKNTEHEYRCEDALPTTVSTSGFEVCAPFALFSSPFYYVIVLIYGESNGLKMEKYT